MSELVMNAVSKSVKGRLGGSASEHGITTCHHCIPLEKYIDILYDIFPKSEEVPLFQCLLLPCTKLRAKRTCKANENRASWSWPALDAAEP